MRQRWIVGLVLGLVFGGAVSAGEREQALEQYAKGLYDEARRLLEQIDAAGQADGPLLYRLAYCQRAAGDTAQSQATQQRALEWLQRDWAGSDELEPAFYLVNSYQNLGREAELKRVAAATVERAERGAFDPIDAPLDQFRLGKLYADLGRPGEASTWYLQAVRGFETQGDANASYRTWATRYLAEQAMQTEDLSAAEQHYTALLELEQGSAADWDRLAVLRARLEMYGQAVEAWRRAEKIDPTQANRPRYCWRLASLAQKLGTLPAADADGRAWQAMDEPELRAVMKAQAARAREAVVEGSQAKKLKKKKRRRLEQQIADAKRLFVAAAMEYAVRGFNIRETAFFDGYAPLIFRKQDWRIRRPKPKKS